MMWLWSAFIVSLSLFTIDRCYGISSSISPFIQYKHSIELEDNVADLWWTLDDAEREITFELHVKTTGWISLGISPAGGMKGADIGVGWVDSKGNVHFQDRYASDFAKPMIDNTTTDWFAIRGREQNGWTAIQFKRLLDTCDSMDYPIKHKILVDFGNRDIVHHLLLHECTPSTIFDDNNLPSGVCDEIMSQVESCSTNFVTVWAVGGDYMVEYIEEVGYPVGDASFTKYYMIQMHYENTRRHSNRRDSSGIRFYLSNELRQHDLGYITFGTMSNLFGLAIPPLVERFVIDSYCPAKVTRVRSAFDYKKTEQWLLNLKWTPALAAQWQKLFDDAPHLSLFARNGQYEDELVGHST
ncbi:unnamed protein product, partial [Rotaria sp. Silwood2]